MVKDPRWAIAVLRRLREHDERYRLVLVRGELEEPTEAARAYVEDYRRDLAELEPIGAVQVLGHTDDVPATLQDIGVVLSASARESFHIGFVEGVASGAVPVVRDWPFFPGATRQLFPADWTVDSVDEAAERVLRLTENEQVWREPRRGFASSSGRGGTGPWSGRTSTGCWSIETRDVDRDIAGQSACDCGRIRGTPGRRIPRTPRARLAECHQLPEAGGTDGGRRRAAMAVVAGGQDVPVGCAIPHRRAKGHHADADGMTAYRLPLTYPVLAEPELESVGNAIRSGWVGGSGPAIGEFEASFAAFCEVAHGVAVMNGTAALHLALEALDVGRGDKVIVPDLTFAATAEAVVHAGAVPVLVDVDPVYWALDPLLAEQACTPQTKAIIPVHLYGHPADMAPILRSGGPRPGCSRRCCRSPRRSVPRPARRLSRKHRRFFLLWEQAPHDWQGRHVRDRRSGSRRANALPPGSRPTAGPTLWHDEVGWNYRMTNLQAALGVAQMKRIDELIADRQRLGRLYRDAFAGTGIVPAPEEPWGETVYWLYSVLLPAGVERDRVMLLLAEEGIETRPFFYPLHEMPPYRADASRYPVATDLARPGRNLAVVLRNGAEGGHRRCRHPPRRHLQGMILAVIPARGGSRGIPRKNLRRIAGKPMIAYTIQAALASRRVDQVVLSTDDPEIAQVARQYGASVPFLRPAALARDDTPTPPVVEHAVSHVEAGGGQVEVVVTLQPTSPFTGAPVIDQAIELREQAQADTPSPSPLLACRRQSLVA